MYIEYLSIFYILYSFHIGWSLYHLDYFNSLLTCLPAFAMVPNNVFSYKNASQIMELLCKSSPGHQSHWKPKVKFLFVQHMYPFYISFHFSSSFNPL